MSASPPLNEYERLLELSALDLDYDDLREYLKDLTLLASRITHSEVSLVNLIDAYTQGGESLVELADSIMSKKEQQEPDDNQFSCKTLSKKLKDLYLPQARAKGVSLELRLSEEYEEVFFSKKHILQILGNLLSNSIKFTSTEGWIRVSIHVETEVEPHMPNKLIVKVEDNGTGMPETRIRQILGGHAASESGTDGEIGYGFGLNLVRHLVDQAGGRMDLQSKPGQGTEFIVKLPV